MTENSPKDELQSANGADESTIKDIARIADVAPAAIPDTIEETTATPIIPDEVYNNLPDFLKGCCSVFEPGRERDVFLTAALTVLSGCFNNVSGVYNGMEVFTNVYAMVVASAASGKSAATFAKRLGMALHKALIPAVNGGVAQMRKLFYVPANISYAAFIKNLENSGGRGTIFETETDTLTGTIKQDWAGYSDLLRRAFHHEAVTYCRKQFNEYIEIEMPQLSMFLLIHCTLVNS